MTTPAAHASIAERLEHLPMGRFHNRLFVGGGIAWAVVSACTGIVSFVLAALKDQWQLQPDQIGLVTSIGLVGMLVGGISGGMAADRYGRRSTDRIYLIVAGVATLANALAWDLPSLMVLRFLAGIGLGGVIPITVTLVGEFAPASHRGRITALLEPFWGAGWFIAALVALLILPSLGWPATFAVGLLSIGGGFLLHRLVPESPRHLAHLGRTAEAEKIVAGIERDLGLDPNRPRSAVAALPVSTRLRRPQPRGFAGLWSSAYRRRTMLLWTMWFTLNYSYYGLFSWLPILLGPSGASQQQTFLYAAVVALGGVPGSTLSALLVDRAGRKVTLVVYLLFAATCTYWFGLAAPGWILLLSGFLASFFSLGAWGIMSVYTAELYPTSIRALGAGWAGSFGRIASMAAPLVVAVLIGTWGGGYTGAFLSFAVALLVAGLAVLVWGEETKGKTLEALER